MDTKMVTVSDFTFNPTYANVGRLVGSLTVRDLKSNKVEQCLFSVIGNEIVLDPDVMGLPDITKFQQEEISRHLGLIFKVYKQHNIINPGEKRTFIL